ncbi:tetraacyldisaccharide 4'-kinase [Aliiglaciecola sp. 2_MG-2023]|uniref:tetraacyldisaccharide 4'-kinase n=1 Tax=unclassified Aliiglaciecola TaxID=2593648 RepID=UPI0026E41492|nr:MULTISPECIES: tetraacyldisaccharide 4'-kinase [unclassified Aliiglaciecola]MDO6711797.1 tetraacyldisaccharide 4'-kinase [Aliiglaciecola sp. 2_MG-2023]MDO6753029.1 tetraacyldisaccharide 4'-kinase [Aliiglaciecola sp. 1_MG-2023]
MTFIEKVWFDNLPQYQLVKWVLLPLTCLFWLLSGLRRAGYKLGWLKSHKIPVPVIVVGNISVGGNGKTPLVVYLAKWLTEQGYKPGILSRGYGGNASLFPSSVDFESDVNRVGDEPLLIKRRANCPVVIDPKRPRGAKYLVDKHQCNVVICDDGLQHYALQRDIEIVVIDGARKHGNGWLLPMGPLREKQSRLKTVDFVINNSGSPIPPEIPMEIKSGDFINVKDGNQHKAVADFNEPITAIAAIGNPQRFYNLLAHLQVPVKQHISFLDHYQFKQLDFPNGTIVMTEKDAVKCRDIAKDSWWFLPIYAKLPESFTQQLKQKLDSIDKDT